MANNEEEEEDDEELAKEKIVDAVLNGDMPISRTPKPSQQDDNRPLVIPIMKRRSVEAKERHNRQQYPGLDRDTDMLIQKGYTLVDSHEYIGDTSKVIDLSKENNKLTSFHNRRQGFMQRVH